MNVMLEVTGRVRKSRSFDYQALAALPGQVEDVAAVLPGREGAGVRLEAILASVEPDDDADHITLESTDGSFSASVPLDAVAKRGIVVYRMGTAPLSPAKGGPARFFIEDVESCGLAEVDACANVKGLGRIVLSAGPGRDLRPTTLSEHEALHQHD